ncbi:S41 family peptidase [Sediminibacterium sp.]|uniref:S41 family peptidase n=1 Tax=Sediminibacterium sp. TaxID=1917865 RepID=UPI0027377550|nr:S41 family peptidase [Sediminibacterium sp.]MDP3392287.1 S41 family peptidase [Sediminibacterium sp.]MDP3566911.1 S41 family peptidase [Sediminibacterium sp.]
MKKGIFTAFCCWCVVLASAQSFVLYKEETTKATAPLTITKSALVKDIQFWKTTIEAAHVNMYHAVSKESLIQLEKKLLASLPNTVSINQAILVIGKLAAALNEGHLGLPSAKISDSLFQQSLRFPFLIKSSNQIGWEVEMDLSKEQYLKNGGTILAINGKNITSINKQYGVYFGGLTNWKNQQVGTYIRKLLFLHGIKSPYQITALNAEGKKIQYKVNGYNKQQADSITKVMSSIKSNQLIPYSLEILPDSIAYIRYNNMSNDPTHPFTKFLIESFTKIQSSRAKGLIIDIRENGGGNSALAELMIPYFSNKPYRLTAGMKWKVSEAYKKFMLGSQGEKAGPAFYFTMQNGSVYFYDNKLLKQPLETPLRFNGKTALLIGPNTFSSANMFSDGVKTYQLAKVFGTPTAEPGNDYGEMFNFMLPHSQIIARGPSKMFFRADGNENDSNSILPDVLVPSAKNKDAVVDKAREWILEKN